MSNMSHCRCENTAEDLREVLEAIQDGDQSMRELSESERYALEQILEDAEEIVSLRGEIKALIKTSEESEEEEEDEDED
jgi:hypothetical protein